jgi:sulfide:quinone oxidoreductase
MRVVVVGAGFGGLEVTAGLAEGLGSNADVTLIDQTDGFVFGFSKLDVMFGHAEASAVVHRYADIAKPGVRFVKTRVDAIDPVSKSLHTEAGIFEADVLVIALAADLDPAATPGLVEAGHEFYTEAGAFALRDTLAAFEGGRVIVGVTSAPFKCPPAPSECALMTHDLLARRGLLDTSSVSLVMPFGVPVPPSPEASHELLAAFGERGIEWIPGCFVLELDAERRVAHLSDGREMPFDLFLGVPKHKAPDVVVDSGLTVEGWIPVDPATLQTQYPDVYAVGDVTSVGTPKAGVFAEGQAAIVAHEIVSQDRGVPAKRSYDGNGICYLEFGDGRVAEVDVTFMSGESPHGTLVGPSVGLQANKDAFGTSRVERWFGGRWIR